MPGAARPASPEVDSAELPGGGEAPGLSPGLVWTRAEWEAAPPLQLSPPSEKGSARSSTAVSAAAGAAGSVGRGALVIWNFFAGPGFSLVLAAMGFFLINKHIDYDHGVVGNADVFNLAGYEMLRFGDPPFDPAAPPLIPPCPVCVKPNAMWLALNCVLSPSSPGQYT